MYIQDILNLFNCIDTRNFLINKFETNSKLVVDNDVFIAINNGINYVDEAIDNGAKAVIVENDIKYNCITINVKSTIAALAKLGEYIRNKYSGKVIAITGSCGKTTTKELLNSILNTKYKVLKSQKNYNNHIGLPLTLLNLNDNYDIVIVELGMNHSGEIDYLSKICKPDYGVITNIGTAHIGNLGNRKKIYNAKMEILNGMRDGYLYVNKDDKYLKRIRYKNSVKINKDSLNVNNICYYIDRTEFDINDIHFVFHIPGKSLLNDLFLAMSLGLNFGIDIKDMQEAIFNFQSIDGRLNIINKDYLMIDDSYNSSYEALINSLDVISTIKKSKIIILGDMLELGKYSKKYHKKINKYLKKINNKEVLLIGNYTEYINGIHFKCVEDIINYLKKHLQKDYILYIKGSRAMNLDRIKTSL